MGGETKKKNEAKHPKFGGLNKATSIALVPNCGACNLGWAQLEGPDGLSWAHSGAFTSGQSVDDCLWGLTQ